MLVVEVVNEHSDLQQIVTDINSASWDEANDLSNYDVESLQIYLSKADTIFLTCYEEHDEDKTLLGMASGRLEYKPYDKERWLYVDEVDVCVNQRRKGAGAALMRKLLGLAEEAGCAELWLGTEIDNVPANALYNSLDPDEVERFVGFNFELDD